MSDTADAIYLKKRIARLKEDLRNWAALEQSHNEAIRESRAPRDRTSSEAELRRIAQMIANVKYEVAELEKVLRAANRK